MNVEDIKLNPVILNEKSSFVVITYWWGRGNVNRNLQTPCPYEIDDATKRGVTLRVKKQGKRYDEMIEDWVENMKKHKLNYLEAEYPMFAVKGGYQNAINYKPHFIEAALRACYPRSVLYIDGDMFIKKYPRILDTPGVDFAARSWSVDIDDQERLCYDPFVFETSGGTLFFGQTPFGYQLLRMWQEEAKKQPGKADDRVLSLLFNNKKMMKDLNFLQLPIEYLWLSLLYNPNKSIKKHRPKPIITHPFCLTSEEAAIEMSDEMLKSLKSRIPTRYGYYVEDRIRCQRIDDIIYEYIAYKDKKTAEQDSDFLKWLKQNDHTIVSYNNRYGQYNSIANRNERDMKSVRRISDHPIVIVTTSSMIRDDYDVHVTTKDMIVSTILKYLSHQQSVIYVPSSSKYLSSSLRSIGRRCKNGYQLIAKNKNKSERHFKKEYMLTIDTSYPIYFSCENTVLFDLLMMSETLQKISYHFNHSSTFISRIRCDWL